MQNKKKWTNGNSISRVQLHKVFKIVMKHTKTLCTCLTNYFIRANINLIIEISIIFPLRNLSINAQSCKFSNSHRSIKINSQNIIAIINEAFFKLQYLMEIHAFCLIAGSQASILFWTVMSLFPISVVILRSNVIRSLIIFFDNVLKASMKIPKSYILFFVRFFHVQILPKITIPIRLYFFIQIPYEGKEFLFYNLVLKQLYHAKVYIFHKKMNYEKNTVISFPFFSFSI